MKTEDPKAPCEAEQERAAQFARKQKWKELPGNRYTAEELRGMSRTFGPFSVHKRRTKVMYLD